MEANLPNSFYLTAGILVVTNIGTIISLLIVIFKAGLFVAKTEAGIQSAKESAIRAHKRIDNIETRVSSN